jgi:hypothetical protein
MNEALVCSIQRGHATLCPPYSPLSTLEAAGVVAIRTANIKHVADRGWPVDVILFSAGTLARRFSDNLSSRSNKYGPNNQKGNKNAWSISSARG